MEGLFSHASIILLCLTLFLQYDYVLENETNTKLYGMGGMIYDTLFFKIFKLATILIQYVSIIILSIRYEWWYSLIYIGANFIVLMLAALLILAPIMRKIMRFFFSISSRVYIDREDALMAYCVDRPRAITLLALFVLDIWMIVMWFV